MDDPQKLNLSTMEKIKTTHQLPLKKKAKIPHEIPIYEAGLKRK